MAISLQRVIRSTSCLVLGYRVFGDGGSNGVIYGSNKSKMAATAMLEKFQVAISPQPVVRSTSCSVLGWGFFGDGGSNMALFTVRTNPRPPSWENFKWPYLRNRSSDPLHVWLKGGVFGDGGSNGAIFDSNKFNMAAAAILDNFEWPYLRNGSRSTYIARIARSSLR